MLRRAAFSCLFTVCACTSTRAGLPDGGGEAAPHDAGAHDAGADETRDDDAGTPEDSGVGDAGAPLALDDLASNRERLFTSYGAFLDAGVCETWSAMTPSARAVFFTLTSRLQTSQLRADAGSMLSHVTTVYRIAGGQNATSTNAGSCGGGEYNRMLMSMDSTLHAALVAANAHQGALQSGEYDVSDPPVSSFWRDSHDLGGPHDPFDLSDETEQGAPRGQVQFFADPASTAANAPLGRLQLEALVDPYALELDQDYDCLHASNPLCDYVTYGPLCAPGASTSGLALFTAKYGDPHAEWSPTSCP